MAQPNQPDDLIFDGVIHDSQFAYLFGQPDIGFWRELARECGPRVLELACGTGRITIPLFEAGVAIDGLDFSESMLRVARERAAAKNLPVRFFSGDIRAIRLDDRYDLIFLPSGTLSHLLSLPDLEAFLAGARAALNPGGRLALDVHNPTNAWLDPWPLDPAPRHSQFANNQTGEIVRVSTTRAYRPDTQIFTYANTYAWADGTTSDDTIVLKGYYPAELRALLRYNGFAVERIYGDYAGELAPDSRKYVVLARPADPEEER
ncbi:MAG TPA: class I SAM-dependent methyltransferase [Herpetosiphonaceae bacterium]|nr:class I SAM-dependent methyltransferase [Herpetosiphonaceae bacterium]